MPAESPELLAFRGLREKLVAAGLLIRSGVPGLYGFDGAFEEIIEGVDRYVTRIAQPQRPEVMRFPPVLSRHSYEQTDHFDAFPHLLGSVHSFAGDEAGHRELLRRKEQGKDWSGSLAPTEVVMAPAACYSLYPIVSGTLPPGGRTVDLRAFVFRHEPSEDPARLQSFRMREMVRLGTPEEALAHRDTWLDVAQDALRALGLTVDRVVAHDPFFGRGGKVMAVSQREQALKFELIVPVASREHPTAVFSSNYHLEHFGAAFRIQSADGQVAHSACVGFGLERIAIALFAAHGVSSRDWPAPVRELLQLR